MLKQIASVSFFLGMLPSVIWELLSTLQKNDWLYGIDDLIKVFFVYSLSSKGQTKTVQQSAWKKLISNLSDQPYDINSDIF